MLNFVHAESKRLKIVRSTRRRFSSYQYGWRRHENIRHWIILLKLIYAIIFLCFTIVLYLNQPFDENIEYSKTMIIRIGDLWFSFLGVILICSLFLDRLKRQNLIPSEINNALQISFVICFIIFVIIGHIQTYYRLWWPSSILSIVFLDICPISIAVLISINSLKKHRLWRRVHADTIISNV